MGRKKKRIQGDGQDLVVAYGYVRASTNEQEETLRVQAEAIRGYCTTRGLEWGGEFVDRGVSAKVPLAERPAGRELCGRLRRGDGVVFHKLDRAFRSARDALVMVDLWQAQGVNVHIAQMHGTSVDVATPFGRFFLTIMAGFAEMERTFISERTREAMAGKRRQGEVLNQHAGYGFMLE